MLKRLVHKMSSRYTVLISALSTHALQDQLVTGNARHTAQPGPLFAML